jgi:hypothetical protein
MFNDVKMATLVEATLVSSAVGPRNYMTINTFKL